MADKDNIKSPFSPDDFKIDTGHEALVEDLKELLEEAKKFEFHDFKNEKHPAPKIALKGALSKLIARVEQGWYDNQE